MALASWFVIQFSVFSLHRFNSGSFHFTLFRFTINRDSCLFNFQCSVNIGLIRIENTGLDRLVTCQKG